MKVLSYISTTLLGLMFLVSAFAKAWDAEAFADMLLLYGPQWFSIGAPIIICIEAVMGMCLLLRVSPRISTIAADVFLITVSGIFAYGVLAKGIQDCGCFGALSKLYTGKPWMTFVRNAVFIVLSVPAILDRTQNKEQHLLTKTCATLFVAAAACFICGLSMRKSFVLPRLSSAKVDSREQTMEKLMAVYPFDADSTYYVYLFSFSCHHCQNAFANVEQYQRLQAVDHVLGIAIANEEAEARFYRIYQPQIPILSISQDHMASISGSLPVGLLIRRNTIVRGEAGSVLSPGLRME